MTVRSTRARLEPAHQPRYSRRVRGMRPWGGGRSIKLYATSPACSCGWSAKSNEDKRHAERMWRDHFREVVAEAMAELAGEARIA